MNWLHLIMASSKSCRPTSGPTTRSERYVWLVGYPREKLSDGKLPSRKEVFQLFMHHKIMEKMTIREAASATANDVMKVFEAAGLKTKIKCHVMDKIEAIFKEWDKLKKNKTKRSETYRKKETDWQQNLQNLFDIKAAAAQVTKTQR